TLDTMTHAFEAQGLGAAEARGLSLGQIAHMVAHQASFLSALERLLTERSVSVNTAAAGGNANLMTIG
ncbi:hypothetical protein G3O00_41320, partial [Burkholderia sp. Ac-20384]|uniref:hypothetical protein n=1 Tax=Burkholderia sp. Ac-20384 TaxID=2703902 RepID=UPI00197EC7FA